MNNGVFDLIDHLELNFDEVASKHMYVAFLCMPCTPSVQRQ